MNEKPSKKISVTQAGLLILGLFILAAFLRLCFLSQMAYHHDESLHAYYSYKLYDNTTDASGRSAYKYDPVYHGPFLYHWGALIFFLFGDSDFTGRLPFVLFGLLMLYLVLRLRPYIGTAGVIFTLAAVTVSPVLTYFARFARNDVYVATESLAIVVFALDYFRTKRPVYLIWMLFFLGLLYCTKENSLMMGFILCSYVVLYGAYYIWFRPAGTRKHAIRTIVSDYAPFTKSLIIYGLFSFFAFFYSKIIISQIDWSGIPGDLGLGVIQSQMRSYLTEHSAFTEMWLTFAVVTTAVVFGALWYVRRMVEKGRGDALEGEERWKAISREYYPLVMGWAVVVILYCALFTTLFYHREGLKRGLVEYYAYWIGQQSVRPRIHGGAAYYIPRLALYEILPILFGIAAYVFYLVRGIGWAWTCALQPVLLGALREFYSYVGNPETFRSNLVWHFLEFLFFVALGGLIFAAFKIYELVLKKPPEEEVPVSRESPPGDVNGFRMFLIYWSLSALIIYSILNEKVPWLLTHQALPLCLLAGTFAGDLWNRLGRGTARTAVAVAFCVLAVYGLRSNVLLNFYNPDDPRELMVYTQSTEEVVQVRDEVLNVAYLLGEKKYLLRRDEERDRYQTQRAETLVAMQGHTQWPYVWYFRKYRSHPGMPYKPLPPVVIADPEMDSQMESLAGGKYSVRRYPLRAWWPPWAKTLWPFDAVDDPDQTQINDTAEAWEALWDYVWNRKVWSPPGSSDMLLYVRKDLFRMVPAPEVDEGYDSTPKAIQPVRVWGTTGSAPGQFQGPKGIAVSPDGQRIYVLDSGNARIQVFDPNGTFQAQFGGPGDGPGQFNPGFGGPCGGIDVSPNGTIYATDTWGAGGRGRVLVFDAAGNPVNSWSEAEPGGGFFGPRGIAVAPDGRVFVSDTGHKRLVVFTADGRFMNTIGGEGAGPGQFVEPVGLTVTSNNEVYVADVGNRRIQVLGTDGGFHRQWNILGWTEDSQGMIWVEPYIAVGPDGWIYVSDSKRKLIHRFNRGGKQVVLGKSSAGFGLPKGIACGPEGFVYVVDQERCQVQKFQFQ